MFKKFWTLATVVALLANILVVFPVAAAPSTPDPIYQGSIIDIGPQLRAQDRMYAEMIEEARQAVGDMEFNIQATKAYTVGDKLMWLAMDTMDPMGKNFAGDIFETEYEVRAVEEYCEVWVQTDLKYYNADGTVNLLHPDAKDPEYVTDARVAQLAKVCSEDIRPTDVSLFGAYNDRDGSHSLIGLIDYYYGTHLSDTSGKADRIVVLVSNVRDDNFYDPINTTSFIAGFNWGTFNSWGDRNFITIDSKQWNDRVGNSGHPTRAFTYDSTIAHEMQHLIHGDQDSNEETWINEGMSGFAEFVNGYWVTDKLGDRTQWQQAPENSLTLWGDQPGEILADYQQVNAFFLYMTGHLNGVYTDTASLTQSDQQGIMSINTMLSDGGYGVDFMDVFHNFRRDMLFGGSTNDAQPVARWNSDFIDDYVGHVEANGGPGTSEQYLGEMRDNLDTEGYSTKGVPPFGTDFIELGWGPALGEVMFEGDGTPPATAWQPVTATEFYTPSGTVAGDALYSGHTDLTDNFAVFGPVTPADGDQLTFDNFYNIEDAWDYGFVQVTTDTTGMTGWTSLNIEGMTTTVDSGAHGIISTTVPGFSGFSDGWISSTYTFGAPYAGQEILVAFRYATDWASAGSVAGSPGWAIDNVKVGDEILTDGSTTGRSIQEVRNAGPKFAFEFLTWADGDGVNVTNVYTPDSKFGSVTMAPPGVRAKLDLAAISAQDEGFNGAGERGVLMVTSWLDVFPDLINGGMLPKPANYTLTNVPPSINTSDVSIFGEGGSRTTAGNPFAGEVITMGVYLDNLGYRPCNITTKGAASFVVGLEVPTGTTTYVADSATNSAAYTDDLSTVSPKFPAMPGLYWAGDVMTRTEFMGNFKLAGDLDEGETITATAHFATDNTETPDQYFVDTKALAVKSGLGLSALGANLEKFMPGTTAKFTFVGVNRSNMARAFTLVADMPTDTTYMGVTGASMLRVAEVITSATQVTVTGVISPYASSGTKEIGFAWALGDSYEVGDTITSKMTLTDEVTQDTFDLEATAGIGSMYDLYLPVVTRRSS